MSISHIKNCSFSSWYPKYKKFSPKATIIPNLPKSFINYLLSDSIILPSSPINNDEWSDWSEDDEDNCKKIKRIDVEGSEDSEDEDDEISNKIIDPTNDFKELHEEIKRVLDIYGSVAPKLNWSAPTDAAWISTSKTTKCTSAADIYLLLKSSSYIVHDLTEAFNGTTSDDENNEPNMPFELVLRKWFDLNPSLEFRCFVKDRKIIGITQRDLNLYEYLNELKSTFQQEIFKFFNDNLKETFKDSSFIFDIYIPRPFTKIFLIDINPFMKKTDGLLFSWDELLNPNLKYEFRLVDEVNKSRFASTEHSENKVPKDVVDASLTGEGIAELAEKWQQMLSVN